MAVEDPHGGEMSVQEHQVKTLVKAREWYSRAIPSELPLKVEQHKTRGGRIHVKVYSASGKLVKVKG